MKMIPRNMTNFKYDAIRVEWRPSYYTRELLMLSNTESIDYDIESGYLSSQLDMFNTNIQYLSVYTDIVQGSRFGDTTSNILDIIPIQNIEKQHLIYKPLKYNFIESISIEFRSQNGDLVSFNSGGSSTCLLHIKQI